jgi:L-fucose isomerase-like protein
VHGSTRGEETALKSANIPEVKLGIVAVSRDCFPVSLAERRRHAIVEAAEKRGLDVTEVSVAVESEADMERAVAEAEEKGVNALVVFLGNFGPETPETQIAQRFGGPCMYVAAAEGDGDLIDGRGDAYCGMLNCSYNLGLRHIDAYIPDYPVGTAADIAEMMEQFVPVARAIIGVRNLKIITFGPRPQDFFACNAPIQGLYDLGVEIEENSELDLCITYREHEGDSRIDAVAKDMAEEMGEGRYYPDLLPRMAQFELTLLDWAEAHKGSRKYVAFADKCWPAFPKTFGFEPCYVNSRLVSRGIPVACEVDIYGALSEYIGMCASADTVTLLDINNSVPAELFADEIEGRAGCTLTDTFMGFHCGNTPSCKMRADRAVRYQLIQHRLLEPEGSDPDFTRGTLEGDIAPSDITFFRVQSAADGQLRSYVAEGSILDAPTHSFGGIAIFDIPEMGRFYRHVLIEKRFPHHGAVCFSHVGHALFDIFRFLGIQDISYNHPATLPYPTENPFSGQ